MEELSVLKLKFSQHMQHDKGHLHARRFSLMTNVILVDGIVYSNTIITAAPVVVN